MSRSTGISQISLSEESRKEVFTQNKFRRYPWSDYQTREVEHPEKFLNKALETCQQPSMNSTQISKTPVQRYNDYFQ